MSAFQIAGVALLAVIVLALLRELRPTLLPSLRLCASVVLIGAGIALLAPIVTQIRGLLAASDAGELGGIVMRALGIAMISELAASFCEDMGEQTIARCVSTFGKWEILVLCIPLVDKVLQLAKELLQY